MARFRSKTQDRQRRPVRRRRSNGRRELSRWVGSTLFWLFLAGGGLAALFWLPPVSSWLKSLLSAIVSLLGGGLVVLLAAAAAITVVVRRSPRRLLPAWNLWLGALFFGLSVFGLLALFQAGGLLGQAIVGSQGFPGVLRLLGLLAIGCVFTWPHQTLRLTSNAIVGGRELLARYPLKSLLRSLARRKPTVPLEAVPPFPVRVEPLSPEAESIVSDAVSNPKEFTPSVEELEEETHPAAVAERTPGGWRLPAVDILETAPEVEFLSQVDNDRRARLIEETLANYGVDAKVAQVNQGPTVTQFGLEPGWDIKYREVKERDADGHIKLDRNGQPKTHLEEVSRTRVKVNRITSLANDLALALAAPSIRIEAPVPGRPVVGVEVPNSIMSLVALRSVIESTAFQRMRARSKLALALGKSVEGEGVVADLARMPHLLIAGATGSGKSVCINSIISCLLMHTTPGEVRLLMIDPKRVELVGFKDVPHLLQPVVVDLEQVVDTLKRMTWEMDNRYRLFASVAARNIDAYNRSPRVQKPLPYIVLIIDELADLMMVSPYEVERLVCRLAQLARATGIHLVIATQRPSVDVVTGLIKANFPTRIAFAVTSYVDSRTILDGGGAEKLLGRGDMLYMPTDAARPRRLQGVYVSDQEIDRLVGFWKAQSPYRLQPEQFANGVAEAFASLSEQDTTVEDPLLQRARELIAEHSYVSISFLQRRLRIGYNKAATIMEVLEEEGLVGPPGPGRSRQVLAPSRHQGDDGAPGDFPGASPL